jgi:hypothetical protein
VLAKVLFLKVAAIASENTTNVDALAMYVVVQSFVIILIVTCIDFDILMLLYGCCFY